MPVMSDLYKTKKAITNYIDANNGMNKIRLIGLFTREATVIEEDKYYKGIDEIKMWRRKINAACDMTLEIVGGSTAADGIIVDILYTGEFPESPLIAQHHFILKNNLITYLKINRVTKS